MNNRIAGIGMAVPKNKVTSDALEKELGISSGYSESYNGVKERYFVTDETVSSMGAEALTNALDDAGLELSDIDMLIGAGVSFDYALPHRAVSVLAEMTNGNNFNLPAIDVNNSCLSFVSAFEVASNLLQNSQYKRIAIIDSEISSKNLNPKDEKTATLFGDAAVAVILEKTTDNKSGLIHSFTQSFTEGADFSIIKGGGAKYHIKDYPYDPVLYSFQMHGKNLLKLAGKRIPEFLQSFFEGTDVNPEEIKLVIPHQASKLGLRMFEKISPFKKEQIFLNLETFGNCISASIPLALYEAIHNRMIQKGDLCMLTGTAAGFSIGGILIRY